MLKRLARVDVLRIDEFGYLNLKPEQSHIFFQLMEERYHRHSTIITTNLDYDEGHNFLGAKPMVEARLSRLRHYCHTCASKGRRCAICKGEEGTPDDGLGGFRAGPAETPQSTARPLSDPPGQARRFVPGQPRQECVSLLRCQAGGTGLDWVAALENCSIRQAALRLPQWFSIGPSPAHPVRGSAWQEERVREKERRNLPLPFALTGVDPSHRYLVERGIDRATTVELGVDFYGVPGLRSGRMAIPIGNARGLRWR